MAASNTPTRNDPKRPASPLELTTAWQTLYTASSGERGSRLLALLASNFTNFGGLMDLAIFPAAASSPLWAQLVGSGIAVPPNGYPLRVPLDGIVLGALDTLQARCQHMKSNPGLSSAAASVVLVGTPEINDTAVSFAGTGPGATASVVYTNVLSGVADSPANTDLVGRIIYINAITAGAQLTPRTQVFGVITGNVTGTKTITVGAGWQQYVGGRLTNVALPTGTPALAILASLRDISETILAQNQFVGGIITAGAAGAQSARVVANNAGIATYGTTYCVEKADGTAGGWGATVPAVSNPYQIASGITVVPFVIEMAA